MAARSDLVPWGLLLLVILPANLGAGCAPDAADPLPRSSEGSAEEPSGVRNGDVVVGVEAGTPTTTAVAKDQEVSSTGREAEPPRVYTTQVLDREDPRARLVAVVGVSRVDGATTAEVDALEWYRTREDAIEAGLDPGEMDPVFIGNEEPGIETVVIAEDALVHIHGTSLADEWFGTYQLSLEQWLSVFEGTSALPVAWYGIWDKRSYLPYWIISDAGVVTHLEEQYLP